MSLPLVRRRSLEVARECAQLGAHPRTIKFLTGLSAKTAPVYDAQHPGPCGRPIALDGVVQEAPLPVQAALRAFAIEYLALLNQGFTPATCLLTAYRYYLSFRREPGFSFDQAFILAAKLSGLWTVPQRELEVAACAGCGCNHLRRTGLATATCPFCRRGAIGRLAALGLPMREDCAPQQARAPRRLAVASPEVERRITEAQLLALGANAHVAMVLTSASGSAGASRNLGLPLFKWSSRMKAAERALLSVTVVTFRGLREAGIANVDALVTAFRHADQLLPGTPLDFNRAFKSVALSEALWGVDSPVLDLVDCSTCRCSHLASLCEARAACPFCELMGKRRRKRRAAGGVSG